MNAVKPEPATFSKQRSLARNRDAKSSQNVLHAAGTSQKTARQPHSFPSTQRSAHHLRIISLSSAYFPCC